MLNGWFPLQWLAQSYVLTHVLRHAGASLLLHLVPFTYPQDWISRTIACILYLRAVFGQPEYFWLQQTLWANQLKWHGASSDCHIVSVDSPSLCMSLSRHQYAWIVCRIMVCGSYVILVVRLYILLDSFPTEAELISALQTASTAYPILVRLAGTFWCQGSVRQIAACWQYRTAYHDLGFLLLPTLVSGTRSALQEYGH